MLQTIPIFAGLIIMYLLLLATIGIVKWCWLGLSHVAGFVSFPSSKLFLFCGSGMITSGIHQPSSGADGFLTTLDETHRDSS